MHRGSTPPVWVTSTTTAHTASGPAGTTTSVTPQLLDLLSCRAGCQQGVAPTPVGNGPKPGMTKRGSRGPARHGGPVLRRPCR